MTPLCHVDRLISKGGRVDFQKGPSGDGDYSRVGGWKGGFSKMGQAKMVMTLMAGRRPRPFAFLNF